VPVDKKQLLKEKLAERIKVDLSQLGPASRKVLEHSKESRQKRIGGAIGAALGLAITLGLLRRYRRNASLEDKLVKAVTGTSSGALLGMAPAMDKARARLNKHGIYPKWHGFSGEMTPEAIAKYGK
jgi:hypothetical protein